MMFSMHWETSLLNSQYPHFRNTGTINQMQSWKWMIYVSEYSKPRNFKSSKIPVTTEKAHDKNMANLVSYNGSICDVNLCWLINKLPFNNYVQQWPIDFFWKQVRYQLLDEGKYALQTYFKLVNKSKWHTFPQNLS